MQWKYIIWGLFYFGSATLAGAQSAESVEVLPALQTDSQVQPGESAIYRDTSVPINLAQFAILGATSVGAFAFYQALNEGNGPNHSLSMPNFFSEQLSQIGEVVALSLPFGFLCTTQLIEQGSAEQRKAVSVTAQLFETLGLTLATTYALKLSEERERPNQSDNLSFPSAHSAESFAAATVIALNYPWYVGVPSLIAASLVGLSRYDLNEHYLSDIITGAGIGIFYAAVSHFVHRRYETHQDRPTRLFMPLATTNTYGLAFQLNM